ncbi:hypothetical protein PAPHI01_2095 [Pancytospora philotis]|nr:hypothetical protein PAPHI01_2095 [Pancytospora philotis]
MALLDTHRVGPLSFAHVRTPQKSFLLDYHAVLYGRAHCHPSFARPPKPLKFCVKRVPAADCLFVGSARSIGCLFAGPATAVHCTRPVYDQLLLMYEEYRGMPLSYEEGAPPGCGGDAYAVVALDDVDIEAFKKRVVFVKYLQQTNLNSTVVTAVPAGTHMGWANYRLLFPNQKTLLYVASYSKKRRFATAAAPVDADYLLLARGSSEGRGEVKELTDFLLRCVAAPARGHTDARTDAHIPAAPALVFPTSMATSFVQIFFHVLAVLEHTRVPVYVVSPIFQRLEHLINIQSEWLNSAFCSLAEPFPLRQYAGLRCCEDFGAAFEEGAKIVFCDALHHSLFGGARIFERQVDVLVAESVDAAASDAASSSPASVRFCVRMETADSELLEGFRGVLVRGDSVLLPSESSVSTVSFSKAANVLDGLLFASGTLENTDAVRGAACVLSVRDAKCWLARALEAERHVRVGGWTVLPARRVKLRRLNDLQIAYRRF